MPISLKLLNGQGQARLEVEILFWIVLRNQVISIQNLYILSKNQKKLVKGKKDPLINFL